MLLDADVQRNNAVVQKQRRTIERRLFHTSYVLLVFVVVIVLWAVLVNHGKRRRTPSASDVSASS